MKDQIMDCEKKPYKPGFFCALFWVITWLGMLGGIVCLFLTLEKAQSIMYWCWGAAGVSAIISSIIRCCEKSNYDGRWSWHWFD